MTFWEDDALEREVAEKSEYVERFLIGLAGTHADVGADTRGRGLAQGITFDDPALAGEITRVAFERGLLLETSGPESEVVKLFPPINIEQDQLEEGLEIFAGAVDSVVEHASVPGRRS
jgi:diaminobutyrate-2-oxoglutarate transaminase